MKNDVFTFEGDMSIVEQEGGYCAPAIQLHDTGWFVRGGVQEATSPLFFDKILERMGFDTSYEVRPIRVRLSIEVLDASAAEADIRKREEDIQRYLANRP